MSESTLVKLPHCWKSHATAHFMFHVDENLPTKIQDGITSLLTLGCYKKYVIPKLVKIFRVHDHHIRMVLLKYFSLYVQLVDQEVLEFEIFPQVNSDSIFSC